MCVLQFGYLLLTCLSSLTPSSVVCSLMSEPSRELSSRIHLHLCVDSHISTEMLHLLIYFSCFSIFSLNNNHSYFKVLIYNFKQLAYLCFCFYCLLFPLINGHISFFSCLLIFIAWWTLNKITIETEVDVFFQRAFFPFIFFCQAERIRVDHFNPIVN